MARIFDVPPINNTDGLVAERVLGFGFWVLGFRVWGGFLMRRKLALRIAIRKIHRILDLRVVGIHVFAFRQEKTQMIR